MPPLTEDKKTEFEAWFNSTPGERIGIKALRKSLHISAQTFRELKLECQLKRETLNHEVLKLAVPKATNFKGGIARREISDTEVLAFRRALYEVAMSEKATKPDRELCAKSLGILVEKQEVTHLISAELIAKSSERADIELKKDKDGIYRVEDDLTDKPPELGSSDC